MTMMIAAASRRLLTNGIHRPTVCLQINIVIHNSFSTTAHKTKRIAGIHANPDSIVSLLLPDGRSVLKKDRKGDLREVLVERAYGHFWMMQDLTKAGSKPILMSEISEADAAVFPTLLDTRVLSTYESVDVPSFFIRDNRARDPSAQCTLVGVAYKDYGYKMLPTWIDPFEAAFGIGNPRAKAMRLSITEGKFTKMLLSGFLTRSFRKATPPQLQSQTLLCFGPSQASIDELNNTLGMHNTLTGYVYLLDGLGRVRFAGSGEATEAEVKRLIDLAMELTPRLGQLQSPSRKKLPGINLKQYY